MFSGNQKVNPCNYNPHQNGMGGCGHLNQCPQCVLAMYMFMAHNGMIQKQQVDQFFLDKNSKSTCGQGNFRYGSKTKANCSSSCKCGCGSKAKANCQKCCECCCCSCCCKCGCGSKAEAKCSSSCKCGCAGQGQKTKNTDNDSESDFIELKDSTNDKLVMTEK